jgi:uncharacterized protein (TIGR03067 family)
MRAKSTPCLFLLFLSVAASSQGGEAAKKAPAELQGKWKLVSTQRDGEIPDFVSRGQPAWHIKGNKVIRAGEEFAILSVLTETAPRAVDLNLLGPAKVYEGIYAVDKDTLKVCFQTQTEGVKERPGKLATEGQPSWRLLVFERIKAGNEPETVFGFVGISIRKEGDRVTVGMVIPKSPAEKAGLKKDDVLLRIAGDEPGTVQETVQQISRNPPGTKLTIRVRRDGKERDITVKMGVIPFFLLD